jgi:hypothetical protein
MRKNDALELSRELGLRHGLYQQICTGLGAAQDDSTRQK